jgi:aspartate carbamoyltransferase catalytic subunit
VSPAPVFKRRHLLGLRGMDRGEIELILNTARTMRDVSLRPIKKVPTLRGRTIINLFMEPSTRTRMSFELAENRLSADTLNFTASGSSVSKGETFYDTARNLQAMNPDLLVVRHSSAGAPHKLAEFLDASVINAGDGAHEHPTQALLDLFTIRERFGRLKGVRVGIFGDIEHSRVARSDIFGLIVMGASVTVGGPPTLIPPRVAGLGVEVEHSLERLVRRVDVLILLRIQKERAAAGMIPSLREYAVHFGLSERKLMGSPDGLVIMHPGPINRGVEISPEVADGPRSLILEQVTNGVAVRMAVLFLLAGGSVHE